jgi:hypothetical protein
VTDDDIESHQRRAGAGRRPQDARAAQREPFAMVPQSLFLGWITSGRQTEREAMALYLYALLDLRQGKLGRPVRGFREVARAIGWQERTVSTYAHVLAEAGLIELTEQGRSKAVMAVAHNPSRGRLNPWCTLVGLSPKAPPKSGARYRHDPQPAPELSHLANPAVRVTHLDVHNAPPEQALPVARDATVPRSLRSEEVASPGADLGEWTEERALAWFRSELDAAIVSSGRPTATSGGEVAVLASPRTCARCGGRSAGAVEEGVDWCECPF